MDKTKHWDAYTWKSCKEDQWWKSVMGIKPCHTTGVRSTVLYFTLARLRRQLSEELHSWPKLYKNVTTPHKVTAGTTAKLCCLNFKHSWVTLPRNVKPKRKLKQSLFGSFRSPFQHCMLGAMKLLPKCFVYQPFNQHHQKLFFSATVKYHFNSREHHRNVHLNERSINWNEHTLLSRCKYWSFKAPHEGTCLTAQTFHSTYSL